MREGHTKNCEGTNEEIAFQQPASELVEEKGQQKELACECLGPRSLWAVGAKEQTRALWATLAGSPRADFIEGHDDARGVNRVPPTHSFEMLCGTARTLPRSLTTVTASFSSDSPKTMMNRTSLT